MNPKELDAVIDLVVIDDHPIESFGVSRLLHRQPDMRVAAVCLSEADAIDAIRRLQPRIVIADLHNPVLAGPRLTQAIRDAAGVASVIIVTRNPMSSDMFRAVGVAGFVATDVALLHLAECIRQVNDGAAWVEYPSPPR